MKFIYLLRCRKVLHVRIYVHMCVCAYVTLCVHVGKYVWLGVNRCVIMWDIMRMCAFLWVYEWRPGHQAWSIPSVFPTLSGEDPNSRAIAPCRKPSKMQNVTTKILNAKSIETKHRIRNPKQGEEMTLWGPDPLMCAEKDACIMGRIFSPTWEDKHKQKAWKDAKSISKAEKQSIKRKRKTCKLQDQAGYNMLQSEKSPSQLWILWEDSVELGIAPSQKLCNLSHEVSISASSKSKKVTLQVFSCSFHVCNLFQDTPCELNPPEEYQQRKHHRDILCEKRKKGNRPWLDKLHALRFKWHKQGGAPASRENQWWYRQAPHFVHGRRKGSLHGSVLKGRRSNHVEPRTIF